MLREGAQAWRSDPELAPSGAVVQGLKTLVSRNRRPVKGHFIANPEFWCCSRGPYVRRDNRPQACSSLRSRVSSQVSAQKTGANLGHLARTKTWGDFRRPWIALVLCLLRSQFFGLAFVTHEFERPFGIFVGLRDFFLHLACGLFHFWRETHVAVVLHAGAGGNQAAHDDVFLQPAQMIDRSLNGSFGQHARCLLEGGSRDERIGGERRLGDTEQQRAPGGRFATIRDRTLVLLVEAELIHLLFEEELGVADVFDLYPAHHLADDHFDVLIRNVHSLKPVDFLNFVHQVRLELLFAQYGQNVVRVERAVHQGFASFHPLAFLHVDVNAARYGVFFFRAVVGCHVEFALSLGHFAEANHAIDFADDGGFARLAGLEQFDNARQTARDVLGLGGLTLNIN